MAISPQEPILGVTTLHKNTTIHMKRYGMVIGLYEDRVEDYKKLHREVWPEVLKMIQECDIRNYSIYLNQLGDAGYFLFSYFEYIGDDFEADMTKMAADPITQKWWAACKPCMKPLKNGAEDDWWTNMSEVFHCD